MADPTEKLSPASRERLIQQSSFLNSLASGLFTTGVVGVLVALIASSKLSHDSMALGSILGMLCFIGSIALHLLGQHLLGGLDEQ